MLSQQLLWLKRRSPLLSNRISFSHIAVQILFHFAHLTKSSESESDIDWIIGDTLQHYPTQSASRREAPLMHISALSVLPHSFPSPWPDSLLCPGQIQTTARHCHQRQLHPSFRLLAASIPVSPARQPQPRTLRLCPTVHYHTESLPWLLYRVCLVRPFRFCRRHCTEALPCHSLMLTTLFFRSAACPAFRF